jgi:hypothetical protein
MNSKEFRKKNIGQDVWRVIKTHNNWVKLKVKSKPILVLLDLDLLLELHFEMKGVDMSSLDTRCA